jgi:hypothetical protein
MKTFEIYNNTQLIFTVKAETEPDAWIWLAQTKSLSIKQSKELYKLKIKQKQTK